MPTIQAADLFAGAGGTSTGLIQACQSAGLSVELLAVNHWDVAVATHSLNHPGVRHLCETLDSVDPRKQIPGGRLHLLVASPECVHHSKARGGRPMNDQSRCTAYHILRWADALSVDNILIEQVSEFRDWGPLLPNGRPNPKLKGRQYRDFLQALRGMGYAVDDRILCAADYGDATTRKRLFIQARKGRRRITWPEATHQPAGQPSLFPAEPWRPAREIIDWSIPGESIYSRKRPLADNTLRRIMAGLEKYSGLPFVVGGGGPTGAGRPQSVERPLGAVLTDDHRALVRPFLVVFRNGQDAKTLEEPLPTMTTMGANFGLCQPFLMPTNHGADTRTHSLESPMPTVTSVDAWAVVEPYLVEFHGGKDSERRTRDVDSPLCTLDTSNRVGICRPFVVKFYSTGTAQSVDEPLDTVTTKDRFALVSPELVDKGQAVGMLDIHFRMLQPHELAAAHSFPSDYQFHGNRSDKVRQIGNSVPVRMARELTGEILQEYITERKAA